MKLLQYTWKNSMMKIANSKMAVFVILMIVVSRSYVGAIWYLEINDNNSQKYVMLVNAETGKEIYLM